MFENAEYLFSKSHKIVEKWLNQHSATVLGSRVGFKGLKISKK